MKRPVAIGIATAVVVVVAFFQILPDRLTPEEFVQRYYSADAEIGLIQMRQSTRQDRYRRLQMSADVFEAQELAQSLPKADAPFAVSIANDVPTATAERIRTLLAAEKASLGDDLQVPLRIHVLADTALRSVYRKVIVRPEAAGEPCTVIVTVGPRVRASLGTNPPERLIGTCGFYARYGLPGAGVSRWFDSSGTELAMSDVPLATRPAAYVPDMGWESRQMLRFSLPYVSCVSGRDEACLQVLSGRGYRTFGPLEEHATALRRATLAFPYDASSPIGGFLARVRTDLGERAFADLWGAADPVPVAFHRLRGTSIASYLRDELLNEARPRRPGPIRHPVPVLVALFIVVVGAAAARRFTPRTLS